MRLRRCDGGNVLIITGLMMMPLIALVGTAIDIGRAQLAQSRLQQACDAATLAGRRAMSDGTVDSGVRSEVQKFFRFNFPQGSYQTAPFTIDVTSPGNSGQTVVITVATSIPTTIMKLWGQPNIPLGVTCNAKQDFVNTDIVLVLDTTGSMADKAIPSDTDTKIVALRKAVLSFYDQLLPVQTQLAANNLRLRFGIVPYASSINVGKSIRAVDPNYIVNGDTWYQSRRLWKATGMNGNTCQQYPYYGQYAAGTCSYFYPELRNYDTTSYLAGNGVDMTPMVGLADSSGYTPAAVQSPRIATWAGCIEERQTVQMSATATSIPAAAYDLDITRIPTDDNSRWKAYWPEAEYVRTLPTFAPQTACPVAAAPMKVWTRAQMSNYLDTLAPDGGTYHDNGMIWGARWASPQGIFAGTNPPTFGGLPVKRFMIFMTDGAFDSGYDRLYSTYGLERFDKRVTPGGNMSNEADQLNRHRNRFNLLCARAKQEPLSYSIWVVAFAQALDTSLTNCANPGQASTAADSAALNAKFVEIGRNIGALRLTR